MRFICIFALILICRITAAADTIHVPHDYPTIQAAINAALTGDTVLVAPGTYVENIDFNGKAILVTSEQGALSTIIDGNRSGSVVTFDDAEGPDSELSGFTITNGGVNDGAGIMCENSGPIICDNIITKNEGWSGAGILCDYAFPIILRNTITENTVAGSNEGGGIFCLHSNARIAFNTITKNTADDGGGVCCFLSSDTITNNIIAENSADMNGGGICYSGNGSAPTIANNIIYRNTSGYIGGGIYLSGHFSPKIVNCTVANNTAGSRGGGIMFAGCKYPKVSNSIFWENDSSGSGPEMYIGFRALPSHVSIRNCLVQGGQSKVYIDGSIVVWGAGMIDEDPLFVDPAQNDYHLTWLSPCINRGVVESAPSGDIDGDARPQMGGIDLGADEYVGDHALGADAFTLSESSGGQIGFFLFGGAPNGGRSYVLLGSVTGTAPGVPLPGGLVTLPLNWDDFTWLVFRYSNSPVFADFKGSLTWATSTGYALLDTHGPLPPGYIGTKFHFAYCLISPFDFVSNPVEIEIVE